MVTKEEAILKVDPKQLDTLLHPNFEPSALKNGKTYSKGIAGFTGSCYRKDLL